MEQKVLNPLFLLPYKSVAALADKFGVTQSAVSKALKRGNPKHPIVAFAMRMLQTMGWDFERYGYDIKAYHANKTRLIPLGTVHYLTQGYVLANLTEKIYACSCPRTCGCAPAAKPY